MEPAQDGLTAFAYQAQTQQGASLSGTLDAPSADAAAMQLQALGLRLMHLSPAATPPSKPRPLTGEDFIAFNQQLANLTAAGLPMEHGLRLIAQDMRRGRLAATVKQIAAELESGKPLAEVFQQHRGQFPTSYASLLEAGVRANNLPGMLLNLSRHLELERRLRGLLWRALSYPLMVLLGLAIVMIFLGVWVMPRFQELFSQFRMKLPPITQLMMSTSRWLPPVLIALVALVLLSPLFWWILRRARLDGRASDLVALHVPLVGPVLRRSLLAAWCDGMKMAIQAGVDLPAALAVAGDASGSPRLAHDSRAMSEWIASGRTPDSIPAGRIIPPSVIAAIALASRQGALAETMGSLSEMYQQQAEARMGAIPGLVTPLILVAIAGIVGSMVAALLMPVVALIQSVSGASSW